MDTYGRELPPEFRRRVIEVFGDDGRRWLDALPGVLEACEQRWQLRLQPPFPLSYGYVALAMRQDGTEAIVKARVPNYEARDEIAALRAFEGDSSVRLLDADPEAGVLLLERISPGTMLKDLPDDEEATVIAARVMIALRRAPPHAHTFPSVSGWWAKAIADIRARYGGGSGPLPAELIAGADATFASGAPSDAMLLHGDVHHENILLGKERGWLTIDPQGVVGDPAYETGTFVRNQLMHRAGASRLLARRIELLEEHLSMRRGRIVEWALAHNVMSACWSLESHGDGWQEAIAVAEMLAELPS